MATRVLPTSDDGDRTARAAASETSAATPAAASTTISTSILAQGPTPLTTPNLSDHTMSSPPSSASSSIATAPPPQPPPAKAPKPSTAASFASGDQAATAATAGQLPPQSRQPSQPSRPKQRITRQPSIKSTSSAAAHARARAAQRSLIVRVRRDLGPENARLAGLGGDETGDADAEGDAAASLLRESGDAFSDDGDADNGDREAAVIVAAYNCACERGRILQQGRMYLTRTALAFHANVLGFQTTVVLPWRSVLWIQKAKTGLIPNAIRVVGADKSHFFASFSRRDEAFDTMQSLLRQATAEPTEQPRVHASLPASTRGSSTDTSTTTASPGDAPPNSMSKPAHAPRGIEPLWRAAGPATAADADGRRQHAAAAAATSDSGTRFRATAHARSGRFSPANGSHRSAKHAALSDPGAAVVERSASTTHAPSAAAAASDPASAGSAPPVKLDAAVVVVLLSLALLALGLSAAAALIVSRLSVFVARLDDLVDAALVEVAARQTVA
ncbi:hypothetical protein HK405_012037 [Cladochytrium tenue]|nr:hypothetical protein HK405_012037 [Cladochytrium tenue]